MVMMVSPGRHRLGHVRPGDPQDLRDPLRRQGHEGRARRGGDPRRRARRAACRSSPRTARSCRRRRLRRRRRQGLLMTLLAPGRPSSSSRNRAPLARPRTIRTESSLARVPRLDWLLLVATAALLVLGTMLVWSATAERDVLTGGDSAGLPARATWSTSPSASCWPSSWRPPSTAGCAILAPPVYVVSLIGLLLVLAMGSTINGSRSWIVHRRHVDPAGGVRQAVGGHRHGARASPSAPRAPGASATSATSTSLGMLARGRRCRRR